MDEIQRNAVMDALTKIAGTNATRAAFIYAIKQFEHELAVQGVFNRDELSGPLIDALFDDNTILKKSLVDGTVMEFYYRTKIAREFFMSEPAQPDHVWEPQTTKLLTQLCQGKQQALVGGAYFGDHVIAMAKRLQNGICHAFEPNADQAAMLARNISHNQLHNVVVNACGLWSSSNANVRLVGNDSLAGGIDLNDDNQGVAIPVVTIDDYCEQQGGVALDLIMLDIEGGEHEVLKGAQRQLARADDAPVLVFEVHRHYVDWDNGLMQTALIQYLQQFGYCFHAIRDYNGNENMAGYPVELIPLDDIYLAGPPHGFNVLAVKDRRLLTSPFFAFCRGVSPKLLRHRDPALHQPLHKA